jgi:hypothetical protein
MPASNGLLAKMLHFHRLRPPGAPGRSLEDALAERLQAGLDPCPDASSSEQALALVLKAAAQPGTERELSGEAAAIDAFLLATSPPHTRAAERPVKRPHARKTPALGASITAGLVAGLCGTAVADALPAPLQRFAHSTFGAPAPGWPVPALTGPSHSASGAPTLSVTASHLVPSTGYTGKISGQRARPTAGGAKTPPAPVSAASSNAKANKGKGTAKGKAKSHQKRKAKSPLKDKATAQDKATAKGKDKAGS